MSVPLVLILWGIWSMSVAQWLMHSRTIEPNSCHPSRLISPPPFPCYCTTKEEATHPYSTHTEAWIQVQYRTAVQCTVTRFASTVRFNAGVFWAEKKGLCFGANFLQITSTGMFIKRMVVLYMYRIRFFYKSESLFTKKVHYWGYL
jgi:hypothetical protein